MNKADVREWIKTLPPGDREQFLREEYSHALMNLGPEAARGAAADMSTWVDKITQDTSFRQIGDQIEDGLHDFQASRWSHSIGWWAWLAILIFGVAFVGAIIYGVWDA